MTDRRWALFVVCALALLLLSCGREDPSFELNTGSIAVLSTPPGAGIRLDGEPLGLVTPDTLELVSEGPHLLQVELAGHAAVEESLIVLVAAGGIARAEFTLQEIPGSLAVGSTPAGASVYVDGAETGALTPVTLVGLLPGDHVVRVTLAGHVASPESLAVNITPEGLTQAWFTLTPVQPPATKVVLLESFSNVCCDGCPELSEALHTLMQTPGHGPDRVLLVKYSLDYPLATDPHYLANVEDNETRALGPGYDFTGYYADLLMGGIPTLVGDGALLGASGQPPLDPQQLATLVDALLDQDPGFALQPTATVAGELVTATVQISADRAVDLSAHTLRVALVENPIEYEEPPCCGGEELIFHWIMRDLEEAEAVLPALAAGASHTETVFLSRDLRWPVSHLYVVAFVQDDATRRVLQAGSNVIPESLPRARQPQSTTNPVPSRGMQP